jgi:hypothetical protein
VDVVAVSDADGALLLGECKWCAWWISLRLWFSLGPGQKNQIVENGQMMYNVLERSEKTAEDRRRW